MQLSKREIEYVISFDYFIHLNLGLEKKDIQIIYKKIILLETIRIYVLNLMIESGREERGERERESHWYIGSGNNSSKKNE